MKIGVWKSPSLRRGQKGNVGDPGRARRADVHSKWDRKRRADLSPVTRQRETQEWRKLKKTVESGNRSVPFTEQS